jgi:flagellar biosynthesis protein FliQ
MDSTGLPANLVREGIGVLVSVGGPVLGALLIVGLVVGVLQAATQINDPAVGFVPRLVAGIAVVAFLGGWILERLAKYFTFALNRIAEGM